jgi:hypothetical protein
LVSKTPVIGESHFIRNFGHHSSTVLIVVLFSSGYVFRRIAALVLRIPSLLGFCCIALSNSSIQHALLLELPTGPISPRINALDR